MIPRVTYREPPRGGEHSFLGCERLRGDAQGIAEDGTVSAQEAAPPPERDPLVLVADDHAGVAEAMTLVLRSRGVRAEATTSLGHEWLLHEVRRLRPAVVVLDLYNGAGSPTTVGAIPSIIGLGARVVVFTGSARAADAEAALGAGATRVLRKGDPLCDTVEAVVAVFDEGGGPGGQDVVRQRPQRDLAVERLAALSRRERDVLLALARGETAAHIADASHVSVATVRSHIRAILTKLGVGSQLAAVAVAHQAGWLEGDG
jgi:DNA-binding NarL/FixJ family response regulator